MLDDAQMGMSPDRAADSTSAAAQVLVERVLGARAPDEWSVLAPWVEALFLALAAGHSCVRLKSTQDKLLLQQAPTLVGKGGDIVPFVVQDGRLYLGRVWQLEQDIARHLVRLARATVDAVDIPTARACLAAWFGGIGAETQQQAAALALWQPFMLINGGPGTGKTTTVAKLLALICQSAWHRNGWPRIALAAPTGKAAAHMAQSLHAALAGFSISTTVSTYLRTLEGQTVHRLLQLRPPLLRSPFGPNQTLPIDILVIDEASMLDLSLLSALLNALRTGTRVILLGDANQLPAVGAGDVLSALAQPTAMDEVLATKLTALLPEATWPVQATPAPLSSHVMTLTYSHRFSDEGGIGVLASAVMRGDVEAMAAAFAQNPDDLVWHPRAIPSLCAPLYAFQAAYWQAVAEHNVALTFTLLEKIMLLSVWRRDAAAFNLAYRQFLMRHGHDAQARWFAGLPIMVTQNDYSVGLYNGDMGVVMAAENGQLMAYFPHGQSAWRPLSLSRLPEHSDAFAITVHKSQGSEYETVWLLAPEEALVADDSHVLFDRALLYTALTRAKQRFVFCGAPAQLFQAAQTQHQRLSGLRAALKRQYQRLQPAPDELNEREE
ncbi:exodeoxyribonuclease V subunit alpha [Snodgrassella sp. CFCC 13594]|uniref:exodeoxyribonuclease V subunit alpha n=1 Tax=Snodgrassella sp. CFCC 13594 TaxID=1775559 RepID=UPI00082A34D0|nr:exodeoxyribonuclease V subunit alpha [Snodgrassella sp. CFCC 13594]